MSRLHMCALLVLILGLVVPAAAQVPLGKTMSFKLHRDAFKDAERIPLALRSPITAAGLPTIAGRAVAVEIGKDSLRVDLDGDGRCEKRLTSGKAKVIEIAGAGDDPRQLLVVHDATGWWVAPASTLVGKHRGTQVVLLDADCDGRFDGEGDWLQYGDGSLHRVEPDLRWVADGEFVGSYELLNEGRTPRLVVQPLARGEPFNELQWRALLVANEFRTAVGLAPTQLDRDRCDGCQKHALYLQLNNYDYSKPWDGVGSHNEVPGNPGYTKEGHRAAKAHATSGTPDAARAILGQTSTMLHRLSYIGPIGGGLGVGAIEGSQNSSARGYSVVGGPDAAPNSLLEVVVVPAAGQRGVPTHVKGERPRVEDDPAFYQRARGYPISVTWGKLPVTDAKLRLFDARGRVIGGRCFTPDAAIHSTRPSNGRTAFFVADKPLERGQQYAVEFTATHASDPVVWTWTFNT